MDLWTILTTLARRWYLSVPLVVASVVGAFVLANALANSYTATATVLIAAPNERLVEVPIDPTDPENSETRTEIIDVNPITEGIGNVGLAAATLQLTLVDDRTVDQMAELDLAYDTYTVDTVGRNTSILAIEANGTSPEQAIATVEYLIVRVDADLEQLQDRLGAPETARIDDEVLTRPTDAFITSSGKPRIILGVTLAGLVLMVLIVSAIDAFCGPLSTSRRASSRPAIESVPSSDEPPAPHRSPARGSAERRDSSDDDESDFSATRWQRTVAR